MNKEQEQVYVFKKQNYILLLIGIALVVIGYLLMVGGGSDDPKVFSEKIFDNQRLTVAPICILAGLAFVIFSIMKKGKKG